MKTTEAQQTNLDEAIAAGEDNDEIRARLGIDWQTTNRRRGQLRAQHAKQERTECLRRLRDHPGMFWVWRQGLYLEDCIRGRVLSRDDVIRMQGHFCAVLARDGATGFYDAPMFDSSMERFVWTAADFAY